MSITQCLLCLRTEIECINDTRSVDHWKCKLCGEIIVTDWTRNWLERLGLDDKKLLTGYSRRFAKQGSILEIDDDNKEKILDEARKLKPIDEIEAQNNFIRYLGENSDLLGGGIKIDENMCFDLALRHDQIMRLTQELAGDKLIKYDGPDVVILLIKGRKEFLKLKTIGSSSKQAFVAMSFSPETKEIFEKAIKPAVERAGFRAYRIDMDRHIDNINNRIIAKIRESRFVIAEFTEHKHGVYFETGYALGLGQPVIWVCKKSDFGKAHFDTKPFNHIVWEELTKLEEELYWFIKANIV